MRQHNKKLIIPCIALAFLVSELGFVYQSTGQKNSSPIDKRSYNLGVIGAFSEVVALGIKKLALSAPLSPEEVDELITDAERIARKNGVSIYLEKDFLTTDLFPEEITNGKYVLLIYREPIKDEYMALKKEKQRLLEAGQYHGKTRKNIARKFGRLLSYPEDQIEKMLMKRYKKPFANRLKIHYRCKCAAASKS
jgi:hypothetical protein